MDDLPTVGFRPAVHRGPRRGHAPQVMLATPATGAISAEDMFNAYANEISELPEVREVIQGSPRRGKRRCRESVFMIIRFARGVSVKKAVRLIEQTVISRLKRYYENHTPEVKEERRARRCAKRAEKRRRRETQHIERWLSPT